MVELVRHRQTKEAATDRFYLQQPRHISTLPKTVIQPNVRIAPEADVRLQTTCASRVTNKDGGTMAAVFMINRCVSDCKMGR